MNPSLCELPYTPRVHRSEKEIKACEVQGDALLTDVRTKSDRLRAAFDGADGIVSVSGMGLMLGLKTVKPASEIVASLLDRGVLCLTAKDKVRLLPALNIPLELLLEAAETIKDVCRVSA